MLATLTTLEGSLNRGISFLWFDPVVRYGADYSNPGNREHEFEPAPNTPYAAKF